ncbi:hypothetical protein MASR2M12_04950 [Bacteroidales bacterium]
MKKTSTLPVFIHQKDSEDYFRLALQIAQALKQNHGASARKSTLKALSWYAAAVDFCTTTNGEKIELPLN